MKRTGRVMVATAAIAALTLAGCGNRTDNNETAEPTNTPTPSPTESHPDFKACMVSDSGGFNDKSFNQTSHDGLVAAKNNLGIQTAEVESNAPSEFADNIREMVNQKCNNITTVGFLLGDATLKAAKKNPGIDFQIVDFAYADDKGNNTAPDNLKGLVFNTGEPSFLAGYLAAGMSETGIVGTFGGQQIPSVTAFMDGFVDGVAKYNEDNGSDVKVIGWDKAKQKGTFTNDFEAKVKGQNAAAEMITQGADIILPVAGPAGLGGLQAAKDAGNVKAIWVDTDGCVSAAEYCDILLSSVMKGMDVAVEAGITDSVKDTFSNELYVGTLENGGVDLAPFHEFEDSVPQELKDKLEELKQQIIDGSLAIG